MNKGTQTMSSVDLLMLGILMQGPRNAYEVVRFIHERQASRMVKISDPAVFKGCKRLYENGYLDGETVHEEGVPDKVVYAINAKGRVRFLELMHHFAATFKPLYLDINAVIWNISNLERPEAESILTKMQQQIHMAREAVGLHEAQVAENLPFGARQIVKQYRMIFTTLAQWIDELIAEYGAIKG
jgi:DNA-binding PadR family transcriptional regulator